MQHFTGFLTLYCIVLMLETLDILALFYILFTLSVTSIFRCSLPTAMSISGSEILRRKKGPKMKKSWEIMVGEWEVMGGLWGFMGGQ